jgi:hypothetical protein
MLERKNEKIKYGEKEEGTKKVKVEKKITERGGNR